MLTLFLVAQNRPIFTSIKLSLKKGFLPFGQLVIKNILALQTAYLGLFETTFGGTFISTSQWPLFSADSPFVDSYLNLSTMAIFFCSQGGCCCEVDMSD